MSDIEELLHDKYCDHIQKYNTPPPFFELSPDIFHWLLSEVSPYGGFTFYKEGVHHFMGVRIVVNYNKEIHHEHQHTRQKTYRSRESIIRVERDA